MKRFHFRLEGLLRLRRLEEERKLSCFHSAKLRLFEVLAEMQDIAGERKAQIDQLESLTQGCVPVDEVRVYRRYLSVLDHRTNQAQQALTRLREEMTQAKRDLDLAIRARKVVEKLRERQFENYRQEVWRQETAFLDEISLARRDREEWP